MGSKKTRNKELKENKKLNAQNEANEASEKVSARKGKALLNMAALLSVIIIIYMGNLMSNTVDPKANLKTATTIIQNKLNLENAEAISSDFAGDATYVSYKQNDKIGLVKGRPLKLIQSRFNLDTDLGFIPNGNKVATHIHRYDHKKQDRVVFYGDLIATKADYAEVTYNGKTEKVDFESSAPFMKVIEFEAADNQSVTVKIFDKDNNEITKELISS